MNYESVDRIPLLTVEPYEKTAIERWVSKGMGKDSDPVDFFEMDRFDKVPVRLLPYPRYEHKVLQEDDDYITETDTIYGAVVRKSKRAPSMFYGFIDHQVKSMEDWKRIKFRYEDHMDKRFPVRIDEEIKRLNESANPVKLEIFPYFNRLGFYLMGMERFMLSFYDQPALMHEMFSFWNEFTLKMIRPYLENVDIDILVLAEDLAYNNGPNLPPEIYREFWLPYQDELVREAKKHGITNICLWTAGDIDIMIPMLIEHGINCIWPVERCSHAMDPILLRKTYGRELRMGGAIPKECLVQGAEAIEKEIDKLLPVIEEGGFIPALDDMVSPEVPLKTYAYFIDKLRSLL
jgi:uroporphyrinogen decarboxylase